MASRRRPKKSRPERLALLAPQLEAEPSNPQVLRQALREARSVPVRFNGRWYVPTAPKDATLWVFFCPFEPGAEALCYAAPRFIDGRRETQIAMHEGRACAAFHELGPMEFVRLAQLLRLLPGPVLAGPAGRR